MIERRDDELVIRRIRRDDAEHVAARCRDIWGADIVVVHEAVYRPAELDGFLAERAGILAGIVTYLIRAGACEIVTLDAFPATQGTGTALVAAVTAEARRAGVARLWLMTTNDNLNALRFYQRRGFTLVALYRDAVERARRLKPTIPPIGAYGIPIRDEIELELVL